MSEVWTEAIYWQKTEEELLTTINKGDKLPITKIEKIATQTRPKPRLNDATILKQMERLGLGTKSSRPSILEKLVERGYIIRNKTQIISQASGRTLITVLNPIWPDIVTNTFTKNVETKMDEVATGKTQYNIMLDQLKQQYIHLHLLLIQNLPNFVTSLASIDPSLLGSNLQLKFTNKTTSKTIKTKKSESAQVISTPEDLGICPKCQEGKIIKRINRTTNSEFLGCSRYPTCKWTQSLAATQQPTETKNTSPSQNSETPRNTNKLNSSITNPSKKISTNVSSTDESLVCPSCKEGKLLLRTNKASGQEFMGCSRYPTCKYTQKIVQQAPKSV